MKLRGTPYSFRIILKHFTIYKPIFQRFLERVHFLARANRFSARVSHGRFAILLAKA
jgi:hypothetical protein